MQIKEVLQDRILVRPDTAPNITKSGIIIPDSAKEEKAQGTVVMVGPGLDKPMVLQENDHIMYGIHTGFSVMHLGVKHLIMREPDVISIIG